MPTKMRCADPVGSSKRTLETATVPTLWHLTAGNCELVDASFARVKTRLETGCFDVGGLRSNQELVELN
jgi:hypothetical protein